MKNKIYKLKKWLSLEDAAKRLSLEFNEEISVADILQLTIEKSLRISVNFPHDWTGRICDITTDPEIANTYEEVTGIDGNPFKLYNYEKCGKDEYIRVFPEIYSFVAGIWELKLIGNEKLDLEFLLKQEKKTTGG